MKKAQVTLFVVVAMLIVALVVLAVYFMGIKPQKASIDAEPIKAYVQNCVESTGEDAIIFIGQQGGYSEVPEKSIGSYPYYFSGNQSYVPSKEEIEEQISLYINDMLPFCTQNFVDFPDFYVEANPLSINTKTTILEDEIILEADWTVYIRKAETTYSIGKFSAKVKSRLNSIYSVAQSIIEEQIKEPSSICLSCLTKFGTENNLYVDMANYENNTVLFTLVDNQTLIKNQPYEFIFANKY